MDILDEAGFEDTSRWIKLFEESLNITRPHQIKHLQNEDIFNFIRNNGKGWEEAALLQMMRKIKKGLPESLSGFDHNGPSSEECLGPMKTIDSFPMKNLLSTVSAGRALCGVYVSKDVSTLAVETDQMIKCPTNVQLVHPSLEDRQDVFEFSSKEHFEAFKSSMTSMGISLAAKVATKGWLNKIVSAKGDASYERNRKTDASKSTKNEMTFISKSRYHLIPTHAVRLKQERLEMEDSLLKALTDLEESILSTSSVDSRSFFNNAASMIFKRYGTHINMGVLHLGGIYVLNASYECKSSEVDENTENMITSAMHINFSLNCKKLGKTSAEIKNDSVDEKLEREFDKKQLSKIIVRVSKQGGSPNATDIEEWKTSLACKPAIIDRGSDFNSSFCGIWDLIQNHAPCFKYPKGLSLFLKHTWYSTQGDLSGFNVDSEDHADQFVRLMLDDKYLFAENKGSFNIKAAQVRYNLCRKVTGRSNSSLRKSMAEISSPFPQIEQLLDHW